MHFRTRLAAALAAVLLASCGGGDDPAPFKYEKLVSFGDSLSDVGTYAVSGVAAVGGGKFTVNGDGTQIWVELLAKQTGVAAPCAAQTGLNATEDLIGFPPTPVTNNTGCFGYAQGGSRVTNLIGPYNAALLTLGDEGGALGQLTDPVLNQINRHLAASGGRFSATDLITVMAGGNDVFMNLATVNATITAGGDPLEASQAAVVAMGQAGAELAGYVRALIVANGAERVVVVNLPDVSKTPFALSQSIQTQGLILQMSATFNEQLAAGLASTPQALVIDAFKASQDQAANKEQYALTDVTTPVCTSALGSLGCTEATLIEGDVSRYQYADGVHPTPYGYQLLAQLVIADMAKRGWL
jgi:phospholipase/lecithinase/hemolysin